VYEERTTEQPRRRERAPNGWLSSVPPFRVRVLSPIETRQVCFTTCLTGRGGTQGSVWDNGRPRSPGRSRRNFSPIALARDERSPAARPSESRRQEKRNETAVGAQERSERGLGARALDERRTTASYSAFSSRASGVSAAARGASDSRRSRDARRFADSSALRSRAPLRSDRCYATPCSESSLCPSKSQR